MDPEGTSLRSAAASFGQGVLIGAVGGAVITGALTGVSIIASPVVASAAAVGLAGYGAFQLTIAAQRIFGGFDPWTLCPVPGEQRIDEAARVLGAVLGGGLAARGTEFGSRNFRVAPFGNRTGNRYGELPHYHRRGAADPNNPGGSLPGQGIGRHRPWQPSQHDNSFWDRF